MGLCPCWSSAACRRRDFALLVEVLCLLHALALFLRQLGNLGVQACDVARVRIGLAPLLRLEDADLVEGIEFLQLSNLRVGDEVEHLRALLDLGVREVVASEVVGSRLHHLADVVIDHVGTLANGALGTRAGPCGRPFPAPGAGPMGG